MARKTACLVHWMNTMPHVFEEQQGNHHTVKERVKGTDRYCTQRIKGPCVI